PTGRGFRISLLRSDARAPLVGNFDREELLDYGRIRSIPNLELRLSCTTRPQSVLSKHFEAICANIPGLARHLRGIGNLVTAPRTCGCGCAGIDGGYFM